MGIALENFDAVGAWRTHDEGSPIDATGALPDGTKVDGVGEPARLAGRATRDQFVARRHREAADLRARPRRRVPGHADGAVDRARRGRQRNYPFSSLVLGIVKSQPFQMNMKAAGDAATQHGSPLAAETVD